MRFAITLVTLASVSFGSLSAQEIRFRRHVLNEASEFSAANAFDVNGDGRTDIVSGAWWYQAPDWQRHKFRDVQQIRGRFDDYSNLALDVDDDGDLDIVSVNYRSQSLYWCRNPGQVDLDNPALWERIVIDEPGPSETGRLVDMDGDGHLDVLPNGKDFAAWYQVDRRALKEERVRWIRHDLPVELQGHGLGAGDINADGRMDVICPNGWAEGPSEPEGRWVFHADFELARDCGLPILCHDVDGDGDNDLIWGRGHNVGVYWTEQRQGEAEAQQASVTFSEVARQSSHFETVVGSIASTQWVTHAIDTRYSCAHTLMLADLNADDRLDLVSGRRFMGHDGKDPGENDPLRIVWYDFASDKQVWTSHPVTFGGGCGIDLDSVCADLDGDGDLDIVAPARSGLHWIENLGSAPANQPSMEPLHPALPTYDDHQDVSYYVSPTGERHPIETALDHGLRRLHVLQQMEQVMGTLPTAERRIALEPQVESIEDAGSYLRLKLTYRAELNDRVPAYLLIPKSATKRKARAMLCLHPTQFELGKAQICGLGGKPSRFYAHELAERGYVCLAPDYPGFAEYEYDFENDRYVSGTMKAIWNNIRAIDLLESLPCVSRDQIGVIGHSLGGHNALFTAAFDQRIRCVATSCGFTAFAEYYEGNLKGWTSDRYMPRIATEYASSPAQMPFDFPEVLAAIAPRPIFVNAPKQDHNFALQGVQQCDQAITPLYERLGNKDAIHFTYPDATHDFPIDVRQQTYDWIDEKLK